MEHVVLIDPDGPRPQRVRDANGGVQAARVHGRGETVGGGVAEADGVGLGLELGDGADGAEDLFLHDLHVLRDVGEDGGLDEVALFAVTPAARLHFGAFLFAGVDVAIIVLVFDLKLCEDPDTETLLTP